MTKSHQELAKQVVRSLERFKDVHGYRSDIELIAAALKQAHEAGVKEERCTTLLRPIGT
jgi:hypothetical protein